MKRREFITALGGVTLMGLVSVAARGEAYAQTSKKPIHIGVIAFAEARLHRHLDQSLIAGLREKGYVEGENLVIEWRYADGFRDRVSQAAKDLAAMNLDLIVTTCSPTTRALSAVAPNTPIVMADVSDPVGQGLIASYQHPGGKITGTATQFEDLAAKMIELLHEAVPNAGSVAVLFNPNNPVHKLFLNEIAGATQLLTLKLAKLPISQPDHIDTAFDQMRSAAIDAVVVLPDDVFLFNLRPRIVAKSAAATMPSVFGFREAVEEGGLMNYGESMTGGHFRAAYFVDRIMRGAKAADLPVEQPTKFELVINNKTAKALGIVIPTSMLVRAEEVIE
jgi:putative tryptophan/tyrosine transport system substrate-binding protein